MSEENFEPYLLCFDIFDCKLILVGIILHEYNPARFLIRVKTSTMKNLKYLEGKNVKVSEEYFELIKLE